MESQLKIAVVGAGLAGSECAWVLAERYQCAVTLFDMKPHCLSAAHRDEQHFAELVCSNSLKSASRLNPAGLLKNEMCALGSLIVPMAQLHSLPAGEALAVDRHQFSAAVTLALQSHSRIKICSKIVENLNELLSNSMGFDHIIIATGPLTHGELAADLQRVTGSDAMAFYDAIAPIVDADTLDPDVVFYANRETFAERRHSKDKKSNNGNIAADAVDNQALVSLRDSGGIPGTGDYLNIPLTKQEYLDFVDKIIAAPKVDYHDFEDPQFFNGCQPLEVLAESGPLTLAHGPMKGRGLTDPRTGRWPFAAVQLRKEKQGAAAYNMVGFQTRLTWPAQREVFCSLPGMGAATFFRMGTMHRNTYVVSPRVLSAHFSLKACSRVTLAGQITGVEGYLESAASGLWMGHIVGRRLRGLLPFEQNDPLVYLPPAHTALGALMRHPLCGDERHFVPMNIHWGLFADPSADDIVAAGFHDDAKKMSKTQRREILAQRSERAFAHWLKGFHT